MHRNVVVGSVIVLLVLLSACAKHKLAPQAMSSFYNVRKSDGAGGGGGDRDYLRAGSLGALQIRNGNPVVKAEQQVSLSPEAADRKIIRNGSLDLLVNDVAKTVDAVTSVVKETGGYVEKSEQRHTGATTAAMVVRVPAEHLDEAMTRIKALATRVDTDSVQAQDVTREFIDLDARLRNTQAEEARYLDIMKRASTVKDTLEVAEKLSDVRGRIEQLQGEMNYLKTQISLSRLEISLHSESEATVMGLHWRPLRQAKAAGIDMLQGLADWIDDVIAFLVNIPLILVWCISILLLAFIAWRVLQFAWRKLFPNRSVFPAWLRRDKAKPEAPA